MEPDEISPRQAAARQLPNLGLAVLGLLVTHETAYALAAWLRPLLAGDGGAAVDHAHQSLLIATVGPLALWLTAWFVLRQLRNLSLTTIWGPTPLSLAVAGMYLAQETVEVLTAGPAGPGLGGLIGNRAVVIGLLLVPLVARLLLRALDRAEELIQAWLATPSGCCGRSIAARPTRSFRRRTFGHRPSTGRPTRTSRSRRYDPLTLIS